VDIDIHSWHKQITKYAGRMQCAPTSFVNIGWKIIRVHHSGIFVEKSFGCIIRAFWLKNHLGASFGYIV
jgi:hypothetical protein